MHTKCQYKSEENIPKTISKCSRWTTESNDISKSIERFWFLFHPLFYKSCYNFIIVVIFISYPDIRARAPHTETHVSQPIYCLSTTHQMQQLFYKCIQRKIEKNVERNRIQHIRLPLDVDVYVYIHLSIFIVLVRTLYECTLSTSFTFMHTII